MKYESTHSRHFPLESFTCTLPSPRRHSSTSHKTGLTEIAPKLLPSLRQFCGSISASTKTKHSLIAVYSGRRILSSLIPRRQDSEWEDNSACKFEPMDAVILRQVALRHLPPQFRIVISDHILLAREVISREGNRAVRNICMETAMRESAASQAGRSWKYE